VSLLLQENLRRLGVDLAIAAYDYPTLEARMARREDHAFSNAWIPALEPDPEQQWHSRWAGPGEGSANWSALRDGEVDRLIELGQRTLDHGPRQEIWRALHRRLHELQPCLFLVAPATKYALSRGIGGFRTYRLDPGYRIREWFRIQGPNQARPPRDS
jgi:ABC-type transport system substrate-binding protein